MTVKAVMLGCDDKGYYRVNIKLARHSRTKYGNLDFSRLVLRLFELKMTWHLFSIFVILSLKGWESRKIKNALEVNNHK